MRVANKGSSSTSVRGSVINDDGSVGLTGTLISALAPGASVTLSSAQIEAGLGTFLPAAGRPRLRIQSAVELAPVEVTAERPLIQKDVTSTNYSIGSKQVDRLPVKNVQDLLTLFPSVTAEGNVRGGKSSEVVYLVDGPPMQDAVGGGIGGSLPKREHSSSFIFFRRECDGVPAGTSAEEVLALKPDGIFLSNGPGDPAGLLYAVEAVSGLIESRVPMFGICLGHQLIGRALGADTHRLKFRHHGGNHPVQHLPSGEVLITAQNHNYCVTEGDLNKDEVEITYKSLNDESLEGLRTKHKPVFSVQFHPESAPGPHDAHDIFGEFFMIIEGKNEK